MADRFNHYERAFEHFVRSRGVPCIGVDETRRSSFEEESVKNLDFVVGAGDGRWLLVDVKGRELHGKRAGLENWATEDDIASLHKWEHQFGGESTALLVFVYHLANESRKVDFTDHFHHGGGHYGCLGIAARDYRTHMRVRSPRWKTVSLPRPIFAMWSRPFTEWLSPAGQVLRDRVTVAAADCFA